MKLLTVILFFSALAASAEELKVADAYRALRASPNDFVYALMAPMVKQPPNTPRTSRLERFFRLKSKRVDGPTVKIELLPRLPLLTEYFPDSSTVKIELTKTGESKNSFDFDSRIETLGGKWITTKLHVEPAVVGSLLRLSFRDANYSPAIIKIFNAAAVKLGFLYPSAEAAILQTEHDSSAPPETK